ncbi:MAG: PQQ-binding-like beta-propeller repeat protein [Planctomycetes bacterium]|nr:PQQ-binding-like beta-propeller repeat protein [Planctomycetota bacterium]
MRNDGPGRRALFVVALLFAVCSAPAEDAPDQEKALAALVPYVNDAAKAQTLQIWVNVFGKAERVQALKADAKNLTVKFKGNDLPVAWMDLSVEQIAGVAESAAVGNAERALAGADYALAANLPEPARKLLELAQQTDAEHKFAEAIKDRYARLAKLATEKLVPAGNSKPETPAEPAFAAKETGVWPQYGCDGGARFATSGALKFPLEEKWHYTKAAPVARVASTIIYKDRVTLSCIGNQNGDAKIGDPANNPYLVALDFAKGQKSWEWSHKHDWALGCYLAAAEGSVIYNDDGLGGVAVEKGEATWGGGADSWGQISVDEQAGLIVVGCTMKVDNAGPNITAYDLKGKHKWTALQEGGNKCQDGMPFCQIAQGAGMVFVSAKWAGAAMKRPKGLYALKQADGSEVWKLEGDWGGVSCDGKCAYAVKKDDGKLYCLNPADGAPVWSLAVGGEARHPPALARGLCVVLTDEGALSAVPTEGKNVGKSAAWQGQAPKPFPQAGLYLSGLRMGGTKEVLDEQYHTYRRACMAIAEGAGKNGALIVASGGIISAYDLKSGGSLWSTQWDEKTLGPVGNPAIANGFLIVNSTSTVVCFGSGK